MLHPSTRKLVEKLYNLTVERRVVWIENSRGNGVYAAGSYEVEVSADPCEFRIRRAGGHELEISGLSDLAEMQTEDGRSYDRIVRELAIDSVRIATGLEQAITCLAENLDDHINQDEPTYPDQNDHEPRRIVDFAGATQKRSLLRRHPADEQVIEQADSENKIDQASESGKDYLSWT